MSAPALPAVPAPSDSSSQWKRYPAYKESDVEWLGDVPEHWEVTRLRFVAPVSPVKLTEKPESLLYLGLEHVESKTGRLLLDVPVEKVDSAVGLFERGDVLFGKLRPYLAKVVFAEFSGVCTTELLILKPGTKINGKFLFYQLLSSELIKAINSLAYGARMPRVGENELNNVRASLPPLSEQQTIAAFLDRETAKIDQLIAKKERQIALLQEKRAATISHTVTRGLDASVPLKDSGMGWLGEIPAHWEVRRLKFAAQLESGHTPSRTVPEYWENTTIPWVTLNDVGFLKDHDYIFEPKNYINELGIAHSSARLLPKDTVILSRDATVGRCGILGRPMATSQHFVNWICRDELIPTYLLLVFRGPMQREFARLTMGATIGTIGMPDVNSFRIPLPSIDEQRHVVSHIYGETAKIDALVAKIRENIAKLCEYRTALISAAVTGKIDVRGQG